jgi:5-amino-6-(5-phosphoribosylamino)uracil reductase
MPCAGASPGGRAPVNDVVGLLLKQRQQPCRHAPSRQAGEAPGRRAAERREDEVAQRPYVLLSAAMSLDGYLDDASDRRLILSDAADLDRVDGVRAGSDAILVGAGTVRADDPRLRVRSAARREERQRHGRPPSPVRVTLTAGGGLDPAARFFARDGIDALVYVPAAAAGHVRDQLGPDATVIAGPDPLPLEWLLDDLAGRGIGRVMVEGGASVLSRFLASGLADELQLAIAPLFVADPAAPRLLTAAAGLTAPARSAAPGDWPRQPHLEEVARAGRMAVLRYRLIAP